MCFLYIFDLLGTLLFALIGGIWLLYVEGFNFSVAVGVGFIALAGVAVEIGIIMLAYLDSKFNDLGKEFTHAELQQSVLEGAQMRIRPVMMTSASIIFGLLPVMYGTGTGSEVMSSIAAPMVGEMVSALILTLIVLPAVYFLWRKRKAKSVD